MSEKPPFGSSGISAILDGFDRRQVAGAVADVEKPRLPFGKRLNPPCQSLSLQHARLSRLQFELHALFDDEFGPQKTPSFRLGGGDAPRLLIGETATILIDAESGLFVFREEVPCSGVIVVTASDERLIDHIICHLAADLQEAGTETANQASRMLVGQTLAAVERRLVLQTLRHCHGNRTRAADMLGVSLTTIRGKLRECWRSSELARGRS